MGLPRSDHFTLKRLLLQPLPREKILHNTVVKGALLQRSLPPIYIELCFQS